MNDRISNQSTPNHADTDVEMHALLQVDPVPGHPADFWDNLDAEMDSGSRVVPLSGRPSASRNLGPMLVAAAVLAAILAGGGYRLLNNPVEQISVSESDAIIENGEGETERAPVPGVETVDAQPGADLVPTSEPPQPVVTSEPPVEATPMALSTNNSSPVLPDGSWRIAPGRALGVSPAGDAAWVRTLSPVGGYGCEGTPAEAVWRVPFDGTTPTVVNSDVDLRDAIAMFIDGDRAALIEGCDGVVSTLVIVELSADGVIFGGTRVSVEGLIPGVADIFDVVWQEDGSLLVIAADGTSVATAVHERTGELRSRTIEAGTAEYRTPETRLAAFTGGAWTVEDREGYVHATPNNGDVFRGTSLHPDGIAFRPEHPSRVSFTQLLMRPDFSGFYAQAETETGCSSPLLFVDFATGTPVFVGEATAGMRVLETDGAMLRAEGFCEEVFTETFDLTESERTIALLRGAIGGDILEPPVDAGISNGRFGFSLVVPPSPWQEVLPRSTNGDGYTFADGEKTIRVFGTHDVEGYTRIFAVSSYLNVFTVQLPDGSSVEVTEQRLLSPATGGRTLVQHGFFVDDYVIVVQAEPVTSDDPDVEALIASIQIGAPDQ